MTNYERQDNVKINETIWSYELFCFCFIICSFKFDLFFLVWYNGSQSGFRKLGGSEVHLWLDFLSTAAKLGQNKLSLKIKMMNFPIQALLLLKMCFILLIHIIVSKFALLNLKFNNLKATKNGGFLFCLYYDFLFFLFFFLSFVFLVSNCILPSSLQRARSFFAISSRVDPSLKSSLYFTGASKT